MPCRCLPFLALPVLLPLVAVAQISLTPAFPEARDASGEPLPLAWLGGLNAPQYQSTDLDGDGISDLLIFDRGGDVPLALRGDGGGNYTEAPELAAGFPEGLTEWLLLRDYDDDGIDDLFAYSAEFDGFRVHRGRRAADGLLTYDAEPTYAGLSYPLGNGTTPIFVTGLDYPAVDDVDMDGDLDILTFSVGGGYLEFYRNVSMERGLGRDTLVYVLESECYGGFFESGLTPALDLAAAPGECFSTGLPPLEFRHAGSTTLSLDADGNGLKDIILGDISFEFLVLALNTGTVDQAYFSEQDASFPSGGTPAVIPFFPAAFHLDVNGDGTRDLLAAPNQDGNAEDVDVGWYYENVGTDADPDFDFRDSQYLVRQTIDYGTGALPAAFDYDGDGRRDLVIGNTDAFSLSFGLDSRLRLFRNVADADGRPAFELVDGDYLGLSAFQNSSSAFAPSFGDLDGDGDEDAVVGERGGQLIYYENLAGPGATARFAPPVFGYQNVDAGQLAKPDVVDLDRDGQADLVVGGFDGRIRFYRNLGERGSPRFDPDPAAEGNRLQLGGINTNRPGLSAGHPAPRVVAYDDRFLLVTGNRSGTLEAYEFTDPYGAFTQLSDTVAGLDVGGFSVPALADFDGDDLLEFVIGNERGGVSYFGSDLAVAEPSSLFGGVRNDFDFRVFPNPSAGELHLVDLPGTRVQRVSVYDGVGRLIHQRDILLRSALHLRAAAQWPKGIYVVSVETGTGVSNRRVVIH